ncbi:MAG: metallophosphoesterase [Polyangiaceae bacterium]
MTFLVVSDLHLEPSASGKTAEALAELVRAHAGMEIVLGGDVFGLSHEPLGHDAAQAVLRILGCYPALVAAFREHLAQGGKLTFIAGNHDESLGGAEVYEALLGLLTPPRRELLSVARWFIRRGAVHVEHGHLWDPDNAPAHPLAGWSMNTEPLGISLTRRFVARRGVWQFAHAHETTLLRGLQRAFQLFGWRAPLLVQQYFTTSAGIVLETLFERGLGQERKQGEQGLSAIARREGVDAQALRELLARAPTPTHVDFASTFLRLYYDRVLAALGAGGGLAWVLRARSVPGAALMLASAAYLSLNVRMAGARYRNRPVRLLRDGAAVVHELTCAKLVVFGHTHVPEVGEHYANSGSFGYAPHGQGRPYLLVDEAGSAELRHHQ